MPLIWTLKHLNLPRSDSGHFRYSAFNRKVFFALIFCRIWQKHTEDCVKRPTKSRFAMSTGMSHMCGVTLNLTHLCSCQARAHAEEEQVALATPVLL